MSGRSSETKMCCQSCGNPVNGHPSIADTCRDAIEARKHLLKLLGLIQTHSDCFRDASVVLEAKSFLSEPKRA